MLVQALLCAATMAAIALAAKDSRTFAVLRLINKSLIATRADPIVQPGGPSGHADSVLDGSNFGFSSTGEDLLKTNRSTALAKNDFSNYWYPILYFHDRKNGVFESIDVYYTSVYYFFEDTNDDIKTFPTSLQMVSVNAVMRVIPAAGGASQLNPPKGSVNPIQCTCPCSSYSPPSYPEGSDCSKAGMVVSNSKGAGSCFPDVTCDGLYFLPRLDIDFPSCYYSAAGLANYKNNTVFPPDASNGMADYPAGWTDTFHIFSEAYMDTQAFQSRWDENQGTQPFAFSSGDISGYSGHHDFMAGWEEDVLQHIIDTCNAGASGRDRCPDLPHGLNSGDCPIIPPLANEQINGRLTVLSGNNSLSSFSYGAAPGMSSISSSSNSRSIDNASPDASSGSSISFGAVTSSNHIRSTKQTAISNAVHVAQHSHYFKAATGAKSKTTGSKPPATAWCATVGVGQCNATTIRTITESLTVTVIPAPASTPDALKGDSAVILIGYTCAGCYKDNRSRVLGDDILPGLGPIANEEYAANCVSKGFSVAGTEDGIQCYCGNELLGSSKLAKFRRATPCEDAATKICGGGWAISVYSKTGAVNMTTANSRRSKRAHHNVRRI